MFYSSRLGGLRILFGDQAMFCRAADFRYVGGFDESLPIMEVGPRPDNYAFLFHRPISHFRISVYRFPRQALTLCPQLCMGIQPGARFPARSADALPATLYGRFTQAIYRNRPITMLDGGKCLRFIQ